MVYRVIQENWLKIYPSAWIVILINILGETI